MYLYLCIYIYCNILFTGVSQSFNMATTECVGDADADGYVNFPMPEMSACQPEDCDVENHGQVQNIYDLAHFA